MLKSLATHPRSMLLLLVLFCLSYSALASTEALEKQALLNNADAQYQLGLAYETGEGVKRDLTKAAHWYQQASENEHPAATFNYAQALEFGRGVQANPSKAALLYTKLAVQGDVSALGKVAKLYQQAAVDIPNEDQAVLWYSLAKDASPSYQEAYDAALQAQFNAQQLRQIEALKQQEQANAPQAVTRIPSPESTSSDWRWLIHASYLVLIGAIIAIGVYLQRQTIRASNDHELNLGQLQQNLAKQQQVIKTLQKQLKSATEQLRSRSTDSQNSSFQKPHSAVRDAYLRFGLNINEQPTARQIKARYKQLSRIYHPDAQGSEEEMKQLNLALNTLTNHLKRQ